MCLPLSSCIPDSTLPPAVIDVNYTGPSNGVWNAAGNWSTSALPTGGQTVCIPPGKGTITIGAGVAALAKDITAASGLAIVATGSLAISDANTALPHPNTVADLSIAAGGTLSSAGSGVSIAGQAVVDGMFSARAQLVSGSLSGTGTIGGFFDNKAGTVRPGGADVVGTLSFGNMFDQESTGTLEIDLASDLSFDKIDTPLNNDFVDGTIVVNLLGGYTPADGTAWAFIPPNGPGTQITAHATPSTFTAHSISMGAELDFHAPDNATTRTHDHDRGSGRDDHHVHDGSREHPDDHHLTRLHDPAGGHHHDGPGGLRRAERRHVRVDRLPTRRAHRAAQRDLRRTREAQGRPRKESAEGPGQEAAGRACHHGHASGPG